jgi:alpha-galactosidase
MLVVGRVGWGNPHPTRLTPDEQYTHLSLWSLLGAPLLIGADLEKLDDFTLGLLTNDEVLAVNQDALGKQGVRVTKDGPVEVFAKQLEDGSTAVGLFNRGLLPATGTVKWTDLNLPAGAHRVRDLWRQQGVGTFADAYSASVAPHGVVFVRVYRAKLIR